MNQIQMIRLLNNLSVPSFYDHAPVGTQLPFIAIHTNQPLGFRADDGNYLKRWDFRIDLYSVNKSLELEADIEALLDANKIPWEQSEQYLDDQSCWEVEYTFDILGEPDQDPEDEDDG